MHGDMSTMRFFQTAERKKKQVTFATTTEIKSTTRNLIWRQLRNPYTQPVHYFANYLRCWGDIRRFREKRRAEVSPGEERIGNGRSRAGGGGKHFVCKYFPDFLISVLNRTRPEPEWKTNRPPVWSTRPVGNSNLGRNSTPRKRNSFLVLAKKSNFIYTKNWI